MTIDNRNEAFHEITFPFTTCHMCKPSLYWREWLQSINERNSGLLEREFYGNLQRLLPKRRTENAAVTRRWNFQSSVVMFPFQRSCLFHLQAGILPLSEDFLETRESNFESQLHRKSGGALKMSSIQSFIFINTETSFIGKRSLCRALSLLVFKLLHSNSERLKPSRL